MAQRKKSKTAKSLLKEAQVRRMMGLAGIPAIQESDFMDKYRKSYFEQDEEDPMAADPAAEEPAPEEELPMEEANLAKALAAAGIQLELDNDELVAEITKRVAARLVRESKRQRSRKRTRK